jgi:hypothetical protein
MFLFQNGEVCHLVDAIGCLLGRRNGGLLGGLFGILAFIFGPFVCFARFANMENTVVRLRRRNTMQLSATQQ